MRWLNQNLPDQKKKLIIVTGATSGIGYYTAMILAMAGAEVIVTGHNGERVSKAVSEIKSLRIKGNVFGEVFDLSRISSIRDFAKRFGKKYKKLDILINNASVIVPTAGTTADGFETQFGVNFLGHYALTGSLFSLLKKSPEARIVTLGSLAHRGGNIDFNNLKLEKPYHEWREYSQSKMACLVFVMELQRRIWRYRAENILSVGAHPGVAFALLQRNIDPLLVQQFDIMDAAQGSLSVIYAATGEVKEGGYYGPKGLGEVNGFPGPAFIDPYALDPDIGLKLWSMASHAVKMDFLLT